MSKTNVYFRADGNSTIGLGHVIRSLAVADMIGDEYDCHFIIRTPENYLSNQILEICKSIIRITSIGYQEEADLLANKYLSENDIIVLDGYSFDTNYQKRLKSIGTKVICIDDIHNYHFCADAVINHAGGITEKLYSAEGYTKFYFGLKYAMLRKEFITYKSRCSKSIRTNDEILICLGGADPNNDTLKVIKKCIRVHPEKSYSIILGGSYIHKNELNDSLSTIDEKIKVQQNLNAKEMAECMHRAKIAITSPSTISYEYLSIGGLLYLKQTADNQQHIYDYFISEGLAFPFSTFPIADNKLLEQTLIKQEEIFDGEVAKRIKNIFKTLA